MSGDRVTIIEPNGVQRSRPLTSRGLTIGRGDENDLVITYAAVSRNHARITFDSGRYYVTDLNSANGTSLGNHRLEPNTPTVWPPAHPLRIGDVAIQLQRSGKTDSRSETFVGLLPEDDQKDSNHERSGALKWLLMSVVIAVLIVALVITALYFVS